MKINLKSGIGELLFGMKEKDVKAVYGEPDRVYKDEDKNIIYLYYKEKLRLTFYQDEDFRLGYIISSNPGLEIFGKQIIGMKWADAENLARENKVKDFEKETFDMTDSYFNEDNWIILQAEFDEVVKAELGATIKNDEFEWKF